MIHSYTQYRFYPNFGNLTQQSFLLSWNFSAVSTQK